MPAPIRIILTEEEDSTLLELRIAVNVTQRTRDRAHIAILGESWKDGILKSLREIKGLTVSYKFKQ